MDLVSLAVLIVSITAFAWTIYADFLPYFSRKKRYENNVEQLARQVRVTLKDSEIDKDSPEWAELIILSYLSSLEARGAEQEND